MGIRKDVTRIVAAAPLVDHHCHGVIGHAPDRAELEDLVTESPWPAGEGLTGFDSQVGMAIRRHCAPVLDLEPGCSPEDYLDRRTALGADTVNRRLLRAARIDTLVVETGYRAGDILGPAEMAEAADATAYEVVRLETVAETMLEAGVAPEDFAEAYPGALAQATEQAVGLKSIAAYRVGLDVEPERPDHDAVCRAARAWADRYAATGSARVDDRVLVRHLLWAGVDRGLPLQIHVGYGDADVDLHRCNPLLLTGWLRATRETGTTVLLLHNYPFHREAGYLAQVYPHVYADVGLALNYTGARSGAVLAESLELTPWHKAMFSSDAFGAVELYLLGAHWYRAGLADVLTEWVRRGDAGLDDAERIAGLIGSANARRVYRLDEAVEAR